MDTIDYIIVMLVIILLVYLMYLKCDFSLDMNEHLLIISIGLAIFGIVLLIIDEDVVNKEYLEDIVEKEPEPEVNVEIDTQSGDVSVNDKKIKSFNQPEKNYSVKQIDEEKYEIPSQKQIQELLKCEDGKRTNKNYGYTFMPPCEWGYVVQKPESEKNCNVCSKMNDYSSGHLILEEGHYDNTTLPPQSK